MENKLGLMQWLYDKGVEPRLYYEVNPTHGRCLMTKDYAENELKSLIGTELLAWHPLEQIIELLPDNIENNYYYLGINKHGIGYLSAADSRHDVDAKYWESNNGDMHLAALKLLKQVMENENGK